MRSLRVGVLSDVHADIHGLDRALQLLMELRVDRIVCLGDVVEKGAHGDAVVRRLNEWCIPVVRGNHEDNALRHDDLLEAEGLPALHRPETRQAIAAYPMEREFLWAGLWVLAAHGVPGNNGQYVFGEPLPKRLKKVLHKRRPDVVLLGHTHRPMALEVDGMWLFNPGSVRSGGRRDSNSCGVLSLPSKRFEVYALSSGRLKMAGCTT